jgi:predicted TIM-barrel fold metal-dependent hydrolase
VKCVPNVYIETSQHLPVVIRELVKQVGADRVIYGSDSPKTDMSVEIEKITRYIQSADDRELIFHANLSKILGGKR